MQIDINEYTKKYAVDKEENNRVKLEIKEIIKKTIKYPNNENLAIYIYNFGGRYEEHTVGDINRNIFIFNNYTNSLAKGKEEVTLDKYGKILPYVGDGILFIDEDDIIIAEYRDKPTATGMVTSTLNILVDLLGSNKLDVFEQLMIDFNKVVISKIEDKNSWSRTTNKEELIKILEKQLYTSSEETIKRIKYNINREESHMENLKQDMILHIKTLKRLSRELELEEGATALPADKIANDLDLIMKNEKVVDIKITEQNLKVMTHELYIYDEKGNKYVGGEYIIDVKLNNSDIKISGNKGHKGYWSDNDPHPHVNGESGKVCFGNLSSTVAELCAQNELYALILSCIDFLENVDIKDYAGKNIKYYDKIDEDGNVIEKNPEDMGLVKCDNCGEYFDQDEMRRVYDTIDICSDGDTEYGNEVEICDSCRNDCDYDEELDEYAHSINYHEIEEEEEEEEEEEYDDEDEE